MSEGTKKKVVKKTAKKETKEKAKFPEKFVIVDGSDYNDGSLYILGDQGLLSTQEEAVEYLLEEDNESLAEDGLLCKVVPVGRFKRNVSMTLEKI